VQVIYDQIIFLTIMLLHLWLGRLHFPLKLYCALRGFGPYQFPSLNHEVQSWVYRLWLRLINVFTFPFPIRKMRLLFVFLVFLNSDSLLGVLFTLLSVKSVSRWQCLSLWLRCALTPNPLLEPPVRWEFVLWCVALMTATVPTESN
jgi:hypothetical protein